MGHRHEHDEDQHQDDRAHGATDAPGHRASRGDEPATVGAPAHDHAGHKHDHGPTNYSRAFAVGVALNVTFVVVEAVFGILSGSLALVADAGHNMSDVLALLLAWGAAALGRRQPTQRRTYGWRRSSILVALVNALSLLIVVGGISWEAIRRLFEPNAVEGQVVIGVAAVGIVINASTAFMFMAGRKNDANIRGAFLHMASDAGVSLGVVIAGFAILITGWVWLDPAISLLIGVVVLVGTLGLLKDAANLALDAVPAGINVADVRHYLVSLPSVIDVHDLHVWAMSTTEVALTAHLVMEDRLPHESLLAEVPRELHIRFGIDHPTLQIERDDGERLCALEPAHVV